MRRRFLRFRPSLRAGVGLGALFALVALGALVASGFVSVELASAKPGRVVRIERATVRPSKNIRACQYSRSGADAQLTCVGDNDFRIGDLFDVVAEDGSFARAEVKSVKPARIDACNLGFTVDLEARVFDEVTVPNQGYTTHFAVRGLELTPGVSKLIGNQIIQAPSGNRRDSVFMAIDANGDDQPNFLAVLSDCPAARRNVPLVPTSRTLTSYCIEYWTRSGTDWAKAGTEVFHYCQ